MKISILLSLFCIILLGTGCGNKIEEADYSIIKPGTDSLYAEWYLAGSTEKMRGGIAKDHPSTNLTGGGPSGFRIFTFMEEDMDPEKDLFPSLHFDSLSIFRVIDGQDSLIYSGIKDADWDLFTGNKGKHNYSLKP